MFNAQSFSWDQGYFIKNPERVKEMRAEIESERDKLSLSMKDSNLVYESKRPTPIENIKRDKEILLKNEIFKFIQKNKTGGPPVNLGT